MTPDLRIAVSYMEGRSGRLRKCAAAIAIARDRVEMALPSGIWDEASFHSVSLIVRFLDEAIIAPVISKVKEGWLYATINLDTRRLLKCEPLLLQQVLAWVILRTVVAITRDMGCDYSDMESLLKEWDVLPDGELASGILGVDAAIEGERPEEQTVIGEEEDLFETVVIRVSYAVEGFGTREDLEKQLQVQLVLDARLRGMGAGQVVGTDTGMGAMNVYCEVESVEWAMEIINESLMDSGLENGVLIDQSDI